MDTGKAINIRITNERSGQRIDKFLADIFPDRSRVFWKNRIDKGSVITNGKIVKPTYKLKVGEQISIIPETGSEAHKETEQRYEIPKINIIHEDDNVIVLDKPAGIPVHKADSYRGPTVVDFLIKYFPKIQNIGEDPARPGIVHRLDKDTSGVLIVAKNNDSFNFLKNQFRNRLVQKTYTALVYGNMLDDEITVNFPIGRSKSNPKMQTAIDQKKKEKIKSREALTIFRVKKRFNEFTLIEAIPKTGRMHQIRVHLKTIGHPIAGDKKYFSKKFLKIEPKPERQFLHAGKLEIELPDKNKKSFISRIPQDLTEFLEKIS